jgi:hypothetical protein
MANVIDPKKKFNHRWKTDPKFIKDFDYDDPKYADVPDDLKWAIPLTERQKTQRAQAENKMSDAFSKQRVEKELIEIKKMTARQSRKLSVVR